MPNRRKQQAELRDAKKAEKRRDLEKEYSMHPGALNPRPVPHLGRYVFTSRKQQQRTLNAIRFIPKPEPLKP